MEHLDLPKNIRLRVPFEAKHSYDQAGFHDFPQRKGFDPGGQQFIDGNFRFVPWEEHTSFFQAWLYFGLLHEVLGAPSQEFISLDTTSITTAALPLYVRQWCDRMHKLPRVEQRQVLAHSTRCLDRASMIVFMLDDPTAKIKNNLDPLIALSIIVLGCTLTSMVYLWDMPRSGGVQYDADLLPLSWPSSSFASRRLEEAGWCKSEIRRLQRLMFASGLLYCGLMTAEPSPADHSQCQENACAAENIDEETYETRHISDRCDCCFMGPDMTKVCSVIDRNAIPLIALSRPSPSSPISIEVVQRRPCSRLPYVAITHVWADGLGNPRENTLPSCQILRLYEYVRGIWPKGDHISMVNQLFGKYPHGFNLPNSNDPKTVLLWMDTLCVPLDREHRRKAIKLMYRTYNEANKTLLLSRSLLPFSANTEPEELLFRITTSAWMRRVWTLQEAILSRNLYAQFSDGSIHVTSIATNLRDASVGSSSYRITLREACISLIELEGVTRQPQCERIALLWNLSQGRSTSKARDEQICFASLIRLDLSLLFSDNADEPMRPIFDQLKHVPSGILWVSGPRINVDGLRWAPRAIQSITSLEPNTPRARRTKRGLLMKGPGYVFAKAAPYLGSRYFFFRDITHGRWLRIQLGVGHDHNNAPQFSWTDSDLGNERHGFAVVLADGVDVALSRAWAMGGIYGVIISLTEPATTARFGIWDICKRRKITGRYMGMSRLEGLDALGERELSSRLEWSVLQETQLAAESQTDLSTDGGSFSTREGIDLEAEYVTRHSRWCIG